MTTVLKRTLILIMAAALAVTMIPLDVFATESDEGVQKLGNNPPLEYVDADDLPHTQDEYSIYIGESPIGTGWYAVTENIEVNTFIIRGEVNLVLCDDATLTVRQGVRMPSDTLGGSLTIWQQSGHTGSLYANGANGHAGIEVSLGSALYINGGNIHATGGEYAAGIGGGENSRNGVINIAGGNVYAYSQGGGAGIGSGSTAPQGSAITITGGKVEARSNGEGAGIGGGFAGSGGEINISGDDTDVLATSIDGAGIGGGGGNSMYEGGDGGSVTISGKGTVHAISRDRGAGIGGGFRGDGGNVRITSGGLVIAEAGYDSLLDYSAAQAIGHGMVYVYGESGTLALYESSEVTYGKVNNQDHAITIEGKTIGSDRNEKCRGTYCEIRPGEEEVLVRYVLNGGKLDGQTGIVERRSVKHKAVLPDSYPTRDGYTFGGWYSDEALTRDYDFDLELLDDQTIYAGWIKEWTVEKVWNIGESEDPPESVDVVLLKKNSIGTWDHVETKTLNEDGDWETYFEIRTGAAAVDTNHYIIREKDMDNTTMYDSKDDAAFEEVPTAYFEVNGVRTGYSVQNKMNEETGSMTITNSTLQKYSVELSWDIDRGDQDRPGEIEVALQRKEGKFTWKSIQLLKLNPGNNWSGTFETVPIGHVEDEVFEKYDYRIREIKPLGEGEQAPQSEEEKLESADERTIHDKFDFDKPFIQNLIKAFDPQDNFDADATLDYLKKKAKSVVIPEPTFVTHIGQYIDSLGFDIPAHDTKYHVKYELDKETNKMKITDTAVVDVSVYKRWLNFEDDEMPESIYVMLMSKVQDDYAQRLGKEDINIYTPVFTVVYGPQLNAINIPELNLDDTMKDGIKSMFGDIAGEAVNGVVKEVINKYTKTGMALTKVKEAGGWNPIAKWHTQFGVKKYGGIIGGGPQAESGLPMDFAGTELVTGFMEMAADILIKRAEIPKVSMPIMYHPLYDCWSVKGYCFRIPVIDKEYQLTGNIVNLKVHLDDSDGNTIRGVKHWVDNGAEDRPDEVTIHIYAKEEDGAETELTGSPVTVEKTEGDDWPWSFEVPLNEIAVIEEDEEGEEDVDVSYKDIIIREDVPEGYTATYNKYDITNKKEGIDVVTITGHKTWDDNDDEAKKRPRSIVIKLLADGKEKASQVVSAKDYWGWRFSDMPKYQNDGKTEIKYTIKEEIVGAGADVYEASYDGYNVTNKYTEDKPTLTIKVSGNTDSKVYNVEEQSFEGTFVATSDDEGFDASKFSYSGSTTASGKDAGDYTVAPLKSACRYDDDKYRVIWEMGDPVKLTITPAEITVKVDGHTKTVTYTGSEQSVDGYDLSCDSVLYDESKLTFSGESAAKGTEASDEKYMMGLAADQFSYDDSNITASILVTDGWLKINPKEEDPDKLTINVTGHSDTVLYNGSEQSVTGYDLSSDDERFDAGKVSFSGEGAAKGTDAGAYPMGLQADQFSYNDTTVEVVFRVTDGELKIQPAPITIMVTGHTDTKTYNGEEQKVEGYDLSCDSELYDESKLTFSGESAAKGTEASDEKYMMGLAANQFSYEDTNVKANFKITDGWLQIDPLRITIKVVGHTDTKTYDGEEHTVEGYDLSCDDTPFDENQVFYSGTAEAKGTDVGQYPMQLGAAEFVYADPNVDANFEVTDGWLKIVAEDEPETITIKVNGNTDTRVYNREEQTFEGVFIATSDDEGFDASKFSYSGSTTASGKDVGDHTTAPVETSCMYDDTNYTVIWEMGDPVKLTIAPAEITVKVNGHTKTVTYTGSEQGVDGYDLSCDSVLYDESKVAFSGEAVVKGTEASDEKYMMGLAADQFSYDDPNITASFLVTDGWLKINPKEEDPDKLTINVTGHSDTVLYNGSEQSVTGYDLSSDDERFDESKVIFGGEGAANGTDAGTYPMGLTADQFSYNDTTVEVVFRVTDGELKIHPAPITIMVIGHTDTKTYNGEEQRVDGYNLSCDSELYDEINVAFSGEAVAKGTEASEEKYMMGLVADQFSYDNPNITASFLVTDGWLKINPKEEDPDKLTINVTGHSDTVLYNSSEQSVTGYDLSSDDERFDAGKVSFGGEGAAKGTDAGTYPMGLQADQFSYNDTTVEVVFRVTDGELKIQPAPITIMVIGHTDTKTYNGEEQRVDGYDLSCDSELYDESKVAFSGEAVAKGTEASDEKYMMGLAADQFSYDDPNITASFLVTDGWLLIKPAITTVSGHKVWDDKNNQDGKRPESITIHLWGDETLVASKTVTEKDEWKWTFDNLPKDYADKVITYTITEDPVTDYVTTINGNAEDGFTVINTYTPGAPDAELFTITYVLNGGSFKGRTDDIIEKYSDGTVISIHEAPVREGYTFDYWMGSAYQPGDRYKVTENHTFTAQWKKNEEPVDPDDQDDPDDPDNPDDPNNPDDSDSPDNPNNPNDPDNPNRHNDPNQKISPKKNPKSGDETNVSLWTTVMILSLIGLVFVGWFRRRRKLF